MSELQPQAVQDTIASHIEQHPAGAVPTALEAATPLIGLGILDSVGLVELVTYLETRFGLEIRDEELVPHNFETLDAITRFVLARA